MIYVVLFVIIIIIVAIVIVPKPKTTICPKCGNKVAVNKNTCYCFTCRTRFIVDENNNVKEIL
jgi:Zn finger protein HypA/HybF involved in hydrogenase expression